MLKGKGLPDYTNLFSPSDFEKNGNTEKMKKLYFVISGKYRKFEKPKISYILEKALVLSINSSKCRNEDKKIIKEE